MYHQKSYHIFVGLWTLVFILFTADSIRKYSADKLWMFIAGPIEEMTPIQWRESKRRPGLKTVLFPVSPEHGIIVPTWKEQPEGSPLPKQKVRTQRSTGSALLCHEIGWVYGVASIYTPKRTFIMVIAATIITAVLWLPFFSRKSSLDRHRERVRRQRRHKKASKFPARWIKGISILFLALAVLAVWWAFASVIPSGNPVPGGIIAFLGIVHIPVLIGMLRDSPLARIMMSVLPWTWMAVLPVGTVLAVVTLAALPNLPETESDQRRHD